MEADEIELLCGLIQSIHYNTICEQIVVSFEHTWTANICGSCVYTKAARKIYDIK